MQQQQDLDSFPGKRRQYTDVLSHNDLEPAFFAPSMHVTDKP